MADENQQPQPQPQNVPPPPPPPPAGGDAALRAELDRARSRNKLLKIAAAVLGVLFLAVAGGAFYIYRKISQTTAAFEEVFRASPTPFPAVGADGKALPLPAFSVAGSTGMPASSLGLFSGSLGDGQGGGIPEEKAERMAKAMAKYAERPIVKEFLADMKRNPETAKAFDASKGGNPLALIAAMRNSKGMETLVAKYATRPEFLALMMEVMRDPEIKPLLVAGGMGNLPADQLPPSLPAAQPVPQPVQSQPEQEQGEEAPMLLDTSAISGTSAGTPAPARKKNVPPPVDSQ